jgi:hypothetical protein
MRLAGAVREAYLTGWAISGGPFTPRVQAGCTAAVALWHRDGPHILETALQLGHLEGVQAEVRERREELLRRHLKAITASWNACISDLPAGDIARRFRRDTHIAAGADLDPSQAGWLKDTGTAAALTWLNGIYHADGYQALLSAIEDALLDGMAEGEADALAAAAARHGKTGFAIGNAFAAARERLDGSHLASQPALDAIAAMIAGAANDTGRSLARLAADGASDDDMTAAVRDLASGDDVRSVRTWTDHALWKAIGAGILALYDLVSGGLATLTVISVDWVTEADRKVCPVCLANAADGPYPHDQVPDFPSHPLCRCDLVTRQRLPLRFLAPFLPARL